MRREASAFLQIAENYPRSGSDPLPADAMENKHLALLAQLYQAADAWSVEAAQTYRRTLAIIAVASTALTLAFLLYDEAEAWGLIIVVGIMLVCEMLATRLAVRSQCHTRYVQLRVLAECLRVEAFLCYGGVGVHASELLPWSVREDLGWVVDVLEYAEKQGDVLAKPRDVRDCWVEGQRAYHANAIARAEIRQQAGQRVVRLAAIASVVLYVITLVFELTCGAWAAPAVVKVADLDYWRAGLKIALGTASAATIFVGSYYDKLSLGRVLDDHRKMAHLYARALARLDEKGQTPELLRDLAREELVENAAWYSYQQANEPEIVL